MTRIGADCGRGSGHGREAEMHVVQRPDGWWIVDVPDTVSECGPYGTRKDAERDLRGMQRFYQSVDDPTFVPAK